MCHVLSFLCVDKPVITPLSLSEMDSEESLRPRCCAELSLDQSLKAFSTTVLNKLRLSPYVVHQVRQWSKHLLI